MRLCHMFGQLTERMVPYDYWDFIERLKNTLISVSEPDAANLWLCVSC